MNNNEIQESEYIKKGYEILYGKLGLSPMQGANRLYYGLAILAIGFALGSYIVPNPSNKLLPDMLAIMINAYSIITVCFCLFSCIRIRAIYRTPQPWKYGLEFSIYFCFVLFLFAFGAIFIAFTMAVYLYNSAFIFPIMSLAFWLISVIAYSLFYIYRGRKKRSGVRKQPKMGNIGKFQILGGVVGGLVVFLYSPQIETLGYIAFLLLPVFSSFPFVSFIFDVFCLQYKKGIDFDAYYAVIDGINPEKNYPPNYGEKKKKR
ncbi:hypothetical protein PWEIH_07696 [Listeria weihenstephanensis FSL R9-0317]|uniref:Uncharacterized protein n=1 Tax=Listeria weihenstephanensis TaxID=1006155 RepID=A0A1S7FVP8_9LIST|nr:hypothetical protein [Listeria weihenstephanensis]AQY51526.1 hypothetical protein UE46_11095 [Listeria weihenstephanensis]EUJ39288.1 hypothetical protein PWEIH_07696 [Listeria weihenstephanensis FSL R9-0317]